MTTRTSQPAGGALLLSEIKEFAAFPKATQRYIRRSLDVAYGRRDALGCWARDDMGAAFAGVFCGVLVVFLLDCGTFMAAAAVVCVAAWVGVWWRWE